MIGVNHAPYFEDDFEDVEIKVGEMHSYYMPKPNDKDPLDILKNTISFVGEQPDFIILNSWTMILIPLDEDAVG